MEIKLVLMWKDDSALLFGQHRCSNMEHAAKSATSKEAASSIFFLAMMGKMRERERKRTSMNTLKEKFKELRALTHTVSNVVHAAV